MIENGPMKARKRLHIFGAVLIALAMLLPLASISTAAPPAPLPWIDPKTIPQFVTNIEGPPPVFEPTNIYDGSGNLIRQEYVVHMTTHTQQLLPAGFPQTPVWVYAGNAMDPLTGASLGYLKNSPAASFEATRGVPVQVRYLNEITVDEMFAVDPTLHWANPNNMPGHMELTPPFQTFPPGYDGTITALNPNGWDAQGNVALVPHLHGGEVQSTSDGGPDAWFTATGTRGSGYSSVDPSEPLGSNGTTYYYPNEQQAGTLWYHDHALGITRINVMSGLAGFYLLRDPADPVASSLPTGKYEVPLAIQDRTFKPDGSLYFDTVGLDPTVHPYWMPEFFGNTIMVNGVVWPNMNVDQGQYRFRLLDGSNARFYTVQFKAPALGIKLPFTVIGSDDAYLKAPVVLNELTMAPGERYDVLVDFSGLPAGTKVIMTNTAKTPFPMGASPDPKTTGKVMQFTVTANTGFVPMVLPTPLNPTLAGAYPNLPAASKQRVLTLFEMMGALGPTMILLNGQMWMEPVSELPVYGSTEEWVIVNPTADTHPIHLHLVQFQLVSRQRMDTATYQTDWMTLNGGMPPYNGPVSELPIAPYLKNKVRLATPLEQGWKDTIQMHPGEVTIIRVRFAPTDGSGTYTFDPTVGPGYVWHCHIIDHEDNEMMRPFQVVAA
jgi:spore coat protein A, manganese oxidase